MKTIKPYEDVKKIKQQPIYNFQVKYARQEHYLHQGEINVLLELKYYLRK